MYERQPLAEALCGARSLSEVLTRLGYRNVGGNHATLRRACEHHGLELPVFDRRNHPPSPFRLSDTEVLRENTPYRGTRLRSRMIKHGIPNLCARCGCEPLWHGKPLTLQIDHINGESTDNRIENLRFLCPNCHSQTETFAGRKRRRSVELIECRKCKSMVRSGTRRCGHCATWFVARPSPKTKVVWPKNDFLLGEVVRTSFSEVGRKLGVSDNAVRKRLRLAGLLPPGKIDRSTG